MNNSLRFRQVHLDFHTSGLIPGIGAKFDRHQWQDMLRAGHVNSVTTFSKCHHGWSYHPTAVGRMHPHLKFDLLRAQMDAAREINVNVPIYLSAGVDNLAAEEHPKWREQLPGNPPVTQAGFISMCFNSPYLDYLCRQIAEAVRRYPECSGVFLDIIWQGECCCKDCRDYMQHHGLSPDRAEDRRACATAAIERYYREATAAVRCDNPGLPVFHNSGHIAKGQRDILKYFSHLELESLPTGPYGYEHFPLSALYSQKTGLDYLGMTGKFHTVWGEFGGYKHSNALRYECAAMLAYGAKCSIGDQLHPDGAMDADTYRLIGTAYAEVERKEPWCDGVAPVAEIAFLSRESENRGRSHGHIQDADLGIGKALMEEHFLFDVIDRHETFARYPLLILADDILLDGELQKKCEAYLAGGGKLLLTGRSGLKANGSGFALDIGATYHGESEFQPDFVAAGPQLAPGSITAPFVMYLRSQQVKPTDGRALGAIHRPYFNRTLEHFCSHQHAPPAEATGYAAAVLNAQGNILYMAHPVFSIYRAVGAVIHRQYVAQAIRLLLGTDQRLRTNLPSTARVSLMHQPAERRMVLHLLAANLILRGAETKLSPEGYVYGAHQLEVIEDLIPLRGVQVRLRAGVAVKRATLEPQGVELPFQREGETIHFEMPEFACHQMAVLHY